MNNDNFYNLTVFEKICLFLYKAITIILFIGALQYGIISDDGNIYLLILSKIFCIIFFGRYLAEQKINEKIGYLLEQQENYDKIINEYFDLKYKDKNK